MRKVLVIAEAGVNHNGNLETAKRLIDAAANAGADYVKFQTFKSESLVSKSAKKAAYQKANMAGEDDSQITMLKKLELDREAHYILREYCSEKNIKFLSTGFDLASLNFLNDFGIDFFKIPSGEITNLPYLRTVGKFGKPVIISTGMADLNEIRDALQVLLDEGVEKDRITILHCNTEYPTPMQDVNLKAMLKIKEEFEIEVGYSDHTLGIEVPTAAVALGASVIEKHFTLDRTMPGPDHKASLEPSELEGMIKAIRNIEAALGNGEKRPSPSELKNKIIARKSIVAKAKIHKGDLFSEENITVKRPGNGISPMKWDEVLGTIALKDYDEDDLI